MGGGIYTSTLAVLAKTNEHSYYSQKHKLTRLFRYAPYDLTGRNVFWFWPLPPRSFLFSVFPLLFIAFPLQRPSSRLIDRRELGLRQIVEKIHRIIWLKGVGKVNKGSCLPVSVFAVAEGSATKGKINCDPQVTNRYFTTKIQKLGQSTKYRVPYLL